MSIIIGLEKLQTQLTTEKINQLNRAAEIHQKQANITFSLLALEDDTIDIEAAQGENKSGKYASESTLIKRTHEVFSLLPEFKVKVHPVTFLPSPASVVTSAWLEKKMREKDIRIKQIAFDTGINRESISDWVTGKRSMSQIVKAMFYFYLTT